MSEDQLDTDSPAERERYRREAAAHAARLAARRGDQDESATDDSALVERR